GGTNMLVPPRHSVVVSRGLVALVGLVACMAGCTPASSGSPTSAPAVAPSAAAGAVSGTPAPRPANVALHITAPAAGQSVPAGSIQVSVSYEGPPLVAAGNATKL